MAHRGIYIDRNRTRPMTEVIINVLYREPYIGTDEMEYTTS